MRRFSPVVVSLVIVLGAANARGDTVLLTNGRKIEGTIVEESTTQVVVQSANGKVVLPRALVKSIERSASPAPAAPAPAPPTRVEGSAVTFRSWGGSCFEIVLPGPVTVLTDPRPRPQLPRELAPDIVSFSVVDREAIDDLKVTNPKVMAAKVLGIAQSAAKGEVVVRTINSLRFGSSGPILGNSITMIAPSRPGAFPRIVHLGDTGGPLGDAYLKAIGAVDVLIVTLRDAELLKSICQQLKPTLAVIAVPTPSGGTSAADVVPLCNGSAVEEIDGEVRLAPREGVTPRVLFFRPAKVPPPPPPVREKRFHFQQEMFVSKTGATAQATLQAVGGRAELFATWRLRVNLGDEPGTLAVECTLDGKSLPLVLSDDCNEVALAPKKFATSAGRSFFIGVARGHAGPIGGTISFRATLTAADGTTKTESTTAKIEDYTFGDLARVEPKSDDPLAAVAPGIDERQVALWKTQARFRSREVASEKGKVVVLENEGRYRIIVGTLATKPASSAEIASRLLEIVKPWGVEKVELEPGSQKTVTVRVGVTSGSPVPANAEQARWVGKLHMLQLLLVLDPYPSDARWLAVLVLAPEGYPDPGTPSDMDTIESFLGTLPRPSGSGQSRGQ